MHKPVFMTAADYFAIQKPNVSYPKNEGEVGRKPGKSHKGYVLADVLAWPTEVYKEVQVNKYILSVTCANGWDSQLSINLLKKIYLLLLSRNKRQMTSRHFTRRWVSYRMHSTFNYEIESIFTILFQVNEIYPYLQNYTNNWAVADFLHVHLRNKVQATKKH